MTKAEKRRLRAEIESLIDTLAFARGSLDIAGVAFAFHEEGKRSVAMAEYEGRQIRGTGSDRMMAALDAVDRL